MSTLYRAATIVFVFNLLSKVLGFVRDAALAAFFGAGSATDAYMIAYTLPYSLQAVLGMAFLTVMVPFLTGHLIQGKREEAFRVTSVVMNWIGLVLLGMVALGMVFAGPLTGLLAPGFDGATQVEAVRLMVIMMPSIFFMGMGMLFSGVLNAQKYFWLAAFGPALVNLIVILAIVVLNHVLGIYGAALGTLMGFAGFFVLLGLGIRQKGFRYHWGLADSDGLARQVTAGILPVAVSVSVNQVLLAVSRFFASGLAPGSISALDYAYRVKDLPLGIFAAAVVTATFPLMSEGAVRNELRQFAATFSKGYSAIMVLIIPVSLGMGALREPLIRVLYQRGAFDDTAAAMTYGALLFFSLALPAFSANMMMTRAYYAFRDYRTPLLAGLGAVAINLAASWMLVGPYGHQGLAAANGLASYGYAMLLFAGLKRRLPQLAVGRLLEVTVKSLAAAGVMTFVVLSVRGFAENALSPGVAGDLLVLGLCTLGGAGVYFALLRVLQYNELDEAIRLFKRRGTGRTK